MPQSALATEGTVAITAPMTFAFLASLADKKSAPEIAATLMRECVHRNRVWPRYQSACQ